MCIGKKSFSSTSKSRVSESQPVSDLKLESQNLTFITQVQSNGGHDKAYFSVRKIDATLNCSQSYPTIVIRGFRSGS